MQNRSSSSQLLLYVGLLAMAFAAIAFGLMTVVQASVESLQAGRQEKTLVELQVESSRSIRQALAKPIVTPPLPPITAHRAHDVAAATAQRRPAPEALNAMAMDQSTAQQHEPQRQTSYPVTDRHATAF